jgi:ABC-type Mn2+/Zn2+ transport system ATPase subunit
MTDAPAAISLEGVFAGYGDRIALSDVTLRVTSGSLLAVVGPNGAGKSTLLKVMAGLLRPFSGTVHVLGEPVGQAARRVAYLPQAEAVDWQFPVAVADVVMMGRYPLIGIARRPSRIDRDHVDAALETVRMSALRGRQIGALSGGQRRRVFLARALAAEPDVFLLDEPVTGVDATTQEELMDVLEAQARAGRTVVASTHDLLCAAQRFHQAAFINGRVVATGPAQLVLDQRLLAETYGGHVLILQGESGTAVALDDAHHHDQPPGREQHFHDGAGS